TVWIGSHNATQRALLGINIEASLVLPVARPSDAYDQAEQVLEAIRARCDLMDPSLVAYYKWLQGADPSDYVIELEDATDLPIPTSRITIFGTEADDHRQLKQVDKQVFVSITSSASGIERFYLARIAQTGEMGSRAGSGTRFDERRYA